MNPYLTRSITMVIASIVFTILNFENINLFYGATIATVIYSVLDNYSPPKSLSDSIDSDNGAENNE